MANFDYLNNYLNNMNKYKQGGMLTAYNVGGTHEQNPNGGVPLGNNATVEQGETSYNTDDNGQATQADTGNKYIFSENSGFNVDNAKLKQFGLPTTRKDGESFASYSKKLINKFEGRNDKATNETKKSFLDRLKTYHEQERQAKEDTINSALAQNSTQNQITQDEQQFATGGQYRAWEQPSSSMSDAPVQSEQFNPSAQGIASGALGITDLVNSAQKGEYSMNSADAAGQGALKGLATGTQIGSMFGPVGAAIGAGAGVLAGGVSGLFGASNARKENIKQINRTIHQADMAGPNYSAWTRQGGYITSQPAKYTSGGGLTSDDRGSDKKPYPSVSSGDFAGGGRSYPIPTKADAVDALRLAGLHGRSDVRSKVFAKYPDLKKADGGPIENPYTGIPEYLKYNPNDINPGGMMAKPITVPQVGAQIPQVTNTAPSTITQTQNTNVNQTPSFADKTANYLGEHGADFMRYSPIISNWMQSSSMKPPTGSVYAKLSDSYKIPQIDEASQLRQANQLYNTQLRNLGQSGGSEAQQRANVLALAGSSSNMMSDVYSKNAEQNRAAKMQEQDYKSRVAQYNAGAIDRGKEAYDRDLGNYDTQKSKFTGETGTALGQIGKENVQMKQIAEMYGYDMMGKFVANKKTGEKMPITDFINMISKSKDKTTIDTTKRFGGFLKNIGK